MSDEAARVFWFPALQSVMTALIIIPIGLTVASLKGWDTRAGLLLGLVGVLIAWVILTVIWMREWRWMYGAYWQDNPQQVNQYPATVRVEFVTPNGNYTECNYLDLPATGAQLYALAKGLAAGESFSVGHWVGTGRPFTRAEFETLRVAMERTTPKLAEWINPNAKGQGMKLTKAGGAVMRKLAQGTPPLEEDEPVQA